MRRSCLGVSQRFVCVGATGLLIGGLLVFATLSATDQIPTHQDDSVPPSSSGATLNELETDSPRRSSAAKMENQFSRRLDAEWKREKLKEELVELEDLEDAIKSRRKPTAKRLNEAQTLTLTRLSRKRAAQKRQKKARTKAKRHQHNKKKSLVDHIVFSKTLTTPKDSNARLALAEAILDGPGQEVLLNEEGHEERTVDKTWARTEEKTVAPLQDEDEQSKPVVKTQEKPARTRAKVERKQADSKTTKPKRRKKNVRKKGTLFKPSKEDTSVLEAEWRGKPNGRQSAAARRVAKHLAHAESTLEAQSSVAKLQARLRKERAVAAHLMHKEGQEEMYLDEIPVATRKPLLKDSFKQRESAVAAHLARAERALQGGNAKEMSLDEISVASAAMTQQQEQQPLAPQPQAINEVALKQAASAVAAHLARAEQALHGGATQEMSLDEINVAAPPLQAQTSLKQAVREDAESAVAARLPDVRARLARLHVEHIEHELEAGNAEDMSLDEIPVATSTPQDSLKQRESAVAAHLARADTTIGHVEESEDALALKRQLAASQAFSQELVPEEEEEEAAVPFW